MAEREDERPPPGRLAAPEISGTPCAPSRRAAGTTGLTQGSGRQLRGGMSSREQDPVVVRIDVRDSDDNYYVGFNHRAKHNSDVPREFSSGAVF